jgi:hypothetical protein
VGNKIRRQGPPRTRWQHKDGIPVKYSRLHPAGLTYAIFPLPPDCPIELRAQIRVLTERLRKERRQARVTFHQIKVYRRKLGEIIDELARKAVLEIGPETDALR